MPIATNQVTIVDLNDGQNGQTTYVHIAYATNATGTAGFSTTDATNKTYMGTYTDFSPTDSTDPTKYTWSLIKGDKGDQGVPGQQGIPGTPGANGQTYYTWIKYADTPTTGISDSPSGKAYIGFAHNKTTATESLTYSDYTWSLIKGEQGVPGVQGTPGTNGQTTYTWFKYADDANGTGMSDSPINKRFLGMAYNKTTATKSTNPADYSWSPLFDNVSVGGRNLLRQANRSFNTTAYNITTYPLVNPPAEGETVTISLKGQLGADRDYFGIYNSGGNVSPTQLLPSHQGADGIYRRTFQWKITQGASVANNTFLSLYHMVSTDTTASTVEWIKLERGNIATDFTVAQEDIDDAIKGVEGIATTARDKINPVITSGGLLMGSKLAPNTVTAQSIAIGDFTNISQINEVTNPNGNSVITSNSKVYFRTGTGGSAKLMLATALAKEFRLNDYYYVALNGYKDAGVTSVTFIIRYNYSDGTWSNAATTPITFTSADSQQIDKCKITADPNPAKVLTSIDFFIEKDSGTSGYFYTRDIDIRKMNTGEMIVDGTITATQIAAGTITGTQIKAGTITATHLNVTSLQALTANLGDVVAGSITNTWKPSADETATVTIARTGDAVNAPIIKTTYSSPMISGSTEMYGWGMKLNSMGYSLIFNNIASSMGIDATNNDLRMGSSKGLRFFPDWNGMNNADFRHFYMITEEPTITHFGGTPAKARQMVFGVANDGDLNGLTTGGHMVIRSGTGYVMLQPEANNAGNNTFTFTIQEGDSSITHGILSYGSVATQGAMRAALRFRKDTAGIEVINTANAESSSTLGSIKASNFYSTGNTVLEADGGYVVIRTTKADSAVYLQSDYESRSVAVNTTSTYKPFRASSFPVGSSINYKQNLEKIEETDVDPLDLVMRTQVWKYHLNSNIDSGVYDKPKIGLISEMVDSIVRDQDGVDPYSIASVAWGAIQKQQRMIEEQQAQIDYLTEMIALLSEKLN